MKINALLRFPKDSTVAEPRGKLPSVPSAARDREGDGGYCEVFETN